MSIRMSVCPSGLGENVFFSAANQDNGLISSSFATYGCFHPCFNLHKVLNKMETRTTIYLPNVLALNILDDIRFIFNKGNKNVKIRRQIKDAPNLT